MASGITFWQLPDEEGAFFQFLLQKDSVFAIPLMEAVTAPGLIQPSPLERFVGRQDDTRLYITPREYALHPSIFEFQRKSLGEPVRYTLGADFPAIVYDPGSLKDGRLSQSNASARTRYVDENATVIYKMPEPYLRWVKRAMGWLRRATPEWHEYRGYRVTKRAAQAALSGLVLVPYHGWSGNSTGGSSFMPGGKKVVDA